jgi:hypothetical protein
MSFGKAQTIDPMKKKKCQPKPSLRSEPLVSAAPHADRTLKDAVLRDRHRSMKSAINKRLPAVAAGFVTCSCRCYFLEPQGITATRTSVEASTRSALFGL